MMRYSYILFLFNIFSSVLSDNASYSAFNHQGIPLDKLLTEIMNFKKGIFVEVGAYDGIWSSNTKLLEEYYDWSGILIEPCEKTFKTLCKNRPHAKCFQCALGSFDEDNTYAYGDFKDSPMSSFTNRGKKPNEIKVLIRSLQSILDECNLHHINFFSLDTEGYELNILKGIDFQRTTFDYMLIEIYKDQYDDIVCFLQEKSYELVCCLTNYNKTSNPGWDGTHNDYLFKKKDF